MRLKIFSENLQELGFVTQTADGWLAEFGGLSDGEATERLGEFPDYAGAAAAVRGYVLPSPAAFRNQVIIEEFDKVTG